MLKSCPRNNVTNSGLGRNQMGFGAVLQDK